MISLEGRRKTNILSQVKLYAAEIRTERIPNINIIALPLYQPVQFYQETNVFLARLALFYKVLSVLFMRSLHPGHEMGAFPSVRLHQPFHKRNA
jgi:hypothetical protein